jgi:hypothetical protein
MLCIILRGHGCDIIVLSIHAPTDDKTDDLKDSFYEELERVVDKFPKCHMKFLLGDFSAEVGREVIYKPMNGNENSYEIGNDKLRHIQKISLSRIQCFEIVTFINLVGHLLMERQSNLPYFDR